MHAKTIITCSLPYGWQEMVKFVRTSKQVITFGGGTEIKHARDSQVQIILDKHAIQDALNHITHPGDPFCSEERLTAYINQFSKNFEGDFSYTYRQELEKGFTDENDMFGDSLNQIDKLRDGLKFQIEGKLPSNRNLAILYNPLKWDMMSSSPCWDVLWIRLERIDLDGTVWVSVATWYRSHDLTDAWESNFIAQVTMIQKEILDPLNAKILYWYESNASLHIYEHNIDLANSIGKDKLNVSIGANLILLQKMYNGTL